MCQPNSAGAEVVLGGRRVERRGTGWGLGGLEGTLAWEGPCMPLLGHIQHPVGRPCGPTSAPNSFLGSVPAKKNMLHLSRIGKDVYRLCTQSQC